MSTLPCNCAFTSFNPCSCSNFPIVAVPQSVFGGAGVPTVVPGVPFAFYIQTDSSPPGQVWEYFNGAWQMVAGGGGGGAQDVFTGTGNPTVTPSTSAALYIQQDSIPPGIIWQWYGGVWH